ncbi:MAG: tetratricopeptide repeat protein [Candidatus Lambdaproteobacteria bacterium]|nr:tetratricopeptide repeat protein [Candidatus Lambdaproteobacteria bacterium]
MTHRALRNGPRMPVRELVPRRPTVARAPRAVRVWLLCCVLTLAAFAPPGVNAVPQSWEQAQQWYEHGQRLERDGFAANALLIYREVVQGYPEHFNSRLALGRMLIASAPAEAVQHLDAARALRPTSPGASFLLGRALEAEGRLLDAAEAYRKTIALDAGNTAANDRLRGILRTLRSRMSLVDQAMEHFWANPSLASLTLLGRIVMRDAEPRQALLEFETLRERLPNLPEVYLWIARAYARLDDPAGEIRAYTEYLNRHPDAVGVRLTLAERQIAQSRYRSADDTLHRLLPPAGGAVLRLDAHDLAQRDLLRSRARSGLGEQEQATALLLEAAREGAPAQTVRAAFAQDVARRPDDGALRMGYGHWLRESGDPLAAIAQFRVPCLRDADLRTDCMAALNALTGNRAAASEARFALGELALAQGQADEAIAQFQRIPAGDPVERRAALHLGMIYRDQGDVERAIDEFTRYVLSFPEPLGMHFARGNLFWVRGARDAAIAYWLRDPRALAGQAATLSEVAPYLQTQGRTAEELMLREMLRDAAPAELANRVRLGTLLLEAGRNDEAAREWDTVLAAGYGNYDVLIQMGRGMLAHGRHAQALQALWQAAQLKPLDDDLSAGLAEALAAAGRREEALRIYWQLHASNPRHPAPLKAIPELVRQVPVSPAERLQAAELAVTTGNRRQAVDLLEELLPLAPENDAARLLLARLLLQIGSPGEAEAVLTAWPDDPAHLERLRMLAQAQEAQGRVDALLGTLTRLRALDPGNTRYDRMLGVLLARRNRLPEAAPLLEQVLAADPADGEVRGYLARHRAEQGELAQAAAHYERLLADNPDQQEPTEALKRIYNAQRDWDPLVVLLERWLRLHPQDAEARDSLVGAYLRDYRVNDARPHYEALREAAPGRARRYEPYFR